MTSTVLHEKPPSRGKSAVLFGRPSPWIGAVVALLSGCCASDPETFRLAVAAAEGTELALKRDDPRGPVIDGDTILVTGLDRSIRIVAIDTEEVFHGPGAEEDLRAAERDFDAYSAARRAGGPRPVKYPTPAGQAARDFAIRFFEDVERVLFLVDDPEVARDYHDRHLGHILVDRDGDEIYETNYAVELVRAGHSPYFVKYGRSRRFDAAFAAAEAEARCAGRGIWSDGTGPPRHYPDYDERLAWWHRRADAIDRFETLHGDDPRSFHLGSPAELERLQAVASAGPTRVVLFGTLVPRPERAHALTIAFVAHKERFDVPLVWADGTPAPERPLDVSAFEEEYVTIEGVARPSRARTGVEVAIEGPGAISAR